MIRLKRDRTASAIAQNFQNLKRRQFNLELMQDRKQALNDVSKKQPFTTSRWKTAKEQLLNESGNKCAYCEAPTAMVAYGDVEHYRPKSKYWWLAYCYENYLASCQLCNQAYKKAKFPIAGTRMKCPVTVRKNSRAEYLATRDHMLTPDSLNNADVTLFETAHQQERPFIPNPYVEDPAIWFAWKADDTLRRVTLVAAPGVANSQRFVDAAERNLGLNRLELQEQRYLEYEKFRTFKLVLKEARNTQATLAVVGEVMKEMMADGAAFAGMLRFFDSIL